MLAVKITRQERQALKEELKTRTGQSLSEVDKDFLYAQVMNGEGIEGAVDRLIEAFGLPELKPFYGRF